VSAVNELASLAENIDWPDHASETRAHEHAKGLGALDLLVEWVSGVQGQYPPALARRPRLMIFAADHGVAGAEVSRHQVGYAAQRADQLRSGTNEPAGLAAGAAVGVRVLDLATSGRIDREDALPAAAVTAAIALGVAAADEEIDAGADLVILGSIGAGASTCAAALTSVLTGIEPIRCVGRGSGNDDAAWMRKASAVRDARHRAWPHRSEPLELLRVTGGADVAATVGFLLQAAARRTPVLLDGSVVAAAGLLAASVHPRVTRWWRVPQLTPEPAHALALAQLGLTAIFDLGLSAGDGTGGLLALPLIQSAISLHLADV
jgi:nicotinate-nucleotide--dimethylbenzimidazole phosphoribosyltransferase